MSASSCNATIARMAREHHIRLSRILGLSLNGLGGIASKFGRLFSADLTEHWVVHMNILFVACY